VCFFIWKHQRDELTRLAKARGITYAVLDGDATANEKREAVNYFQKGFYQVIFAHPQSAAHGLTLTKGTATIWASPTYNLEHFVQGNYRIDRAGQTEKTETIMVVAPKTIEEHVIAQLERKKIRLDTMLATLKEAT
jgi:SNF2 family DNA or RNA helicase